MRSDIEITQSVALRPISEIADALGLGSEDLQPYGRHIAKLPVALLDRLADRPDGRLILVTAMIFLWVCALPIVYWRTQNVGS